MRQMIGKPTPHDSATNDDNAGLLRHNFFGHPGQSVISAIRGRVIDRQLKRTFVPSSIMNQMHVPKTPEPHAILAVLESSLDSLSPEARKAATYVLENPNNVGVSSIREIAAAANVKPNTLVRLARTVGFDGYNEFRMPFRDDLRKGHIDFPDRAQWLQTLSKSGKLGGLYADMAASAIGNIENSYAEHNARDLKKAADIIAKAQRVFVLGVGVNHSLATNFAYLANMIEDKIIVAPKAGGTIIDDLASVKRGDSVIAMTFSPYRKEIIDGAHQAKQQGANVIAITDSRASPLMRLSKIGFLIACETPQFFPSTVATSSFLETLVAFMVAEADNKAIENIRKMHGRRKTLGLYHQIKTGPAK